jgi:hypothetical protein
LFNDWTREISTFKNDSYRFVQKDLFVGFDNNETLQSLVLIITNNYPNANDNEVLKKCKQSLIALATSDGVIRAERLILDPDEIK